MTDKPTEKPRILIVEDMTDNIRVLVELLKEAYQVVPAKNGETALKRLEEGPLPDLVLLDIVMPGMDGYALCNHIKSDPKTAEIPVIFITAVSEAMDDAKAFELGAVDYITKPFYPHTVKARVNTHIKLSRTMKKLKTALKEIKTLSGLIPICSACKKVRDDQGYWNQVETYIADRSDAVFSHGICPDCREKIYTGSGRNV